MEKAQRFSLSIDTDSRTITVVVEKDWSDAIYRLVTNVATTFDEDSFYLLHAGTPLDRMKKVENYNFLCNETLVLLQRYHGGVGGFRPPRGVELKMTDERCCALDDDNPDELRARMPCQCAISATAVKMMAMTTLQDGRCDFQCPGCNQKFAFHDIRDLLSAAMTAEELEVVNKQVDANYIHQPLNDVRQCGTCGTYSQRDFNKAWHGNIHRAVCYTCTKRAQHTIEFCWYCGQQWKDGSGKSCGNSNCQGPAPSLEILANCRTKSVDLVPSVPDTRACPRCGLLITHEDSCKRMKCKVCGCNFCFICLKTQDSAGRWHCPELVCEVAPRQTSIPSLFAL